MSPRHARTDADDDPATGSVPPLRLVDRQPPGHDAPLDPPDDDYSPEVRAVLDAVAALHTAVVGWAATTVDTAPADHAAPPPGGGRHRR